MTGELLIVAALLLAGWTFTKKRGPKIKAGDTVFLFGDSLAQGLRGPLSKLAEASGVGFGADVQQGTRFDQWLTRGPSGAGGATFALISLGTNDAMANPGHQAKVPEWARSISAALKAQGTTPIWILPPPMKFDTSVAHDAVDATGDAFYVSADYPRYDSIHPTPAAFGQWAADIWSTLSR